MIAVSNYELPVLTRWFVIECVRTRTGQYKLTLRRDIIADELNTILEDPIFLEKGLINSVENGLLFQDEAVATSQIKYKEEPLTDSTNAAWIVGYIDRNYQAQNNLTLNAAQTDANYVLNNINEYPYYDYLGSNKSASNNYYKFIFKANPIPQSQGEIYQYEFTKDGNRYSRIQNIIIDPVNYELRIGIGDTYRPLEITNSMINQLKDGADSEYNLISQTQADLLAAEDGKLIQIGDTYKYIKVTDTTDTLRGYNVTGDLRTLMLSIAPTLGFRISSGSDSFKIQYRQRILKLELVDVKYGTYEINKDDFNQRIAAIDCPYSVFAIPFADTSYYDANATSLIVNIQKM